MDPSVLICEPILALGWAADLWYAAWLIVVVSLVWSGTRFEPMPNIFRYSLRCAVKMVIVLLAALIVLLLMDWMT